MFTWSTNMSTVICYHHAVNNTRAVTLYASIFIECVELWFLLNTLAPEARGKNIVCK